MAFPTGWGWSAPITIPALKISGTNSNFPVLLTEANFPTAMIDGGVSSALNGGGDVRFSEDSAGLTQLPCEIVSFVTGTTPAAEVYVKLPTLNSGADKIIYVWYSNPGQVQPLVTSLYGRNAVWTDYGLVVHLGSTATIDSSGNQTITVLGTPTITSQNMRYFDGVLDSLSIAHNTKLNESLNSTCSASVRVRVDYSGKHHILFAKYTGGGANTDQAYRIATNIPIYTKFGIIDSLFPAVVLNTSGKDYIAFTVNNSTASNYFNGTLNSPANTVSTAISLNTVPVTVMNAWVQSKGYLGELRYTNTIARSASWIATEYNNQSSPSTFATAGIPVASGGGATAISGTAGFSGGGQQSVLGRKTATGTVTATQGPQTLVVGSKKILSNILVSAGAAQGTAGQKGRRGSVAGRFGAQLTAAGDKGAHGIGLYSAGARYTLVGSGSQAGSGATVYSAGLDYITAGQKNSSGVVTLNHGARQTVTGFKQVLVAALQSQGVRAVITGYRNVTGTALLSSGTGAITSGNRTAAGISYVSGGGNYLVSGSLIPPNEIILSTPLSGYWPGVSNITATFGVTNLTGFL